MCDKTDRLSDAKDDKIAKERGRGELGVGMRSDWSGTLGASWDVVERSCKHSIISHEQNAHKMSPIGRELSEKLLKYWRNTK